MNKVVFYLLGSSLLFADIFSFQTIDRAEEAYANGEYFKSAQIFKTVEKDDPVVAYNIANAQYKAKMYDQALRSYIKAKGIDEATREYNIGNVYFQKEEFRKAISHYKNALSLRADEDTAHNLHLAQKKLEAKKNKKQNKNKNKEKEKKKKEQKKKPKKGPEKKKDNKKGDENKNKGQDKKSDEEKKAQEQEAKNAQKKQEARKKMRPEERIRKKELSHLMKKLSKKKMPTMMYQGKELEGERNDKNPW